MEKEYRMLSKKKIIKPIILLVLALIVVAGNFQMPLALAASEKYNGLDSIRFAESNIKMYYKEQKSLSIKYTYNPKYSKNFKFKWSSSDKNVATVKDGVVTAVGVGKAEITVKSGTASAKCKVTVSYSDKQKKANKIIDKVIKAEITDDMKTVDKIKVIHDYIVKNTVYDYDNYLKNKIPSESYSYIGVLLNKTAVCQGYAETFQLFMDKLKIPCKTVSGKAGKVNHSWNMVKIGKDWYWVDVTWDNPVPDKGRISYEYFLISDEELSKTHVWDSAYSAKGLKYKYYAYKDYIIESVDDIKKVVERQKSLNDITIVFPEELSGELLRMAPEILNEFKGLELDSISYTTFTVGDMYGYRFFLPEK